MPRLRWLDFLRGIAVVGMVATHVAGALLAERWKQGEIWNNLNISFGFVAPAFLLCSGITLWVAIQRRASQPAQFGKGINTLLRRAGTILLLGYWLQLPVLSLRQLIWRHDPTELARLFDSNILQVIGVAMIVLIACVRLARSSMPITNWVAAVLAVGIIIATPYLWASNIHQHIWLPLGAYVAPQPVASFSLFPHAAYLLVGFAVAPLLLHSRQRFVPALFFALFFLSAAFLLDAWIGAAPPHDNYWHGSIQHTFFRLAGLFFLIALLQLAVPWLMLRCQQLGGGEGPTLIENIGARSLAVYVLHLMLIYGSPVNMGMTGWLNGLLQNAWDPTLSLLFIVAATLLCYGAATLWGWVGRKHPPVAVWGKRLWWIAFWGLFLTIP